MGILHVDLFNRGRLALGIAHRIQVCCCGSILDVGLLQYTWYTVAFNY